MITHTLDVPNQELVLQRRDLAPGPLGVVGNLQFSAEQGGTPSSNRVGAMASDTRHSLTRLRADLASFLNGEPSDARRAQRMFVAEARENSRYIGNLLGSLTAPAVDAGAHSTIAQRLMQLSERSNGDLANLPGGAESLYFYLYELTVSDITALRNGVLGSPAARNAVLNQIPPNGLRHQASQLLYQIMNALDQR